ncbi:MAG: radical SAM protein [Myxococcales bacterium]|nr:radical SAM protein [Myxococcales bacterium]
MAHATRLEHCGPGIHLRALVEISNHCVRACHYCGLRGPNRRLPRFRLTIQEVLSATERAATAGFGTVVLQAGEDPSWTREEISELVRRIKDRFGLAVTLSLGERPREDLEEWKRAGANRYLLRFETSNPELYRRLHPARAGAADRIARLGWLRDLDYEVGTGF